MLRTRLIKDFDQMRTQAFSPPFALMGLIEETEVRGEEWQVLMAYGSISGGVRWVAIFPESKQALFFSEGDSLSGRWDPEYRLFFPEDGPPLNLLGNPVPVPSTEDEAEEEDSEWGGFD
jgi:hypothetical protein